MNSKGFPLFQLQIIYSSDFISYIALINKSRTQLNYKYFSFVSNAFLSNNELEVPGI